MILRWYQERAPHSLRRSIASGNRCILAVAPCGSGKTVIFTGIIRSAVTKGNRCLVCVHKEELLDQAADHLRRTGLEVGLIKAGRKENRDAPVQVASIQSLVRRTAPEAAVVIIDEAHRSTASTYRKILENYRQSVVIGFTASPIRTDQAGLGDIYQDLIEIVTVPELIRDGYLCPGKIFAPSSPDLTGVRTLAGDFEPGMLELAVSQPKLLGDIAEHWDRHMRGKKAIAFAVSIAHSKSLVEALVARGCRAIHLDGGSPAEERHNALARLESGEIDVISNCSLYDEGVDCPALDGVIIARPTKSLARWIQMTGRALRPYPGKNIALILDHSGNVHRHGMPWENHHWSLTMTKPKKPAVPGVKTCRKCFACVPSATRICPDCGTEFVGKPMAQPKVADGLLTEDPIVVRKPSMAWTDQVSLLRGLLATARERGYKMNWAFLTFQRRVGRWPGPKTRQAAGL